MGLLRKEINKNSNIKVFDQTTTDITWNFCVNESYSKPNQVNASNFFQQGSVQLLIDTVHTPKL